MSRKSRINIAIVLISIGIVANVIILAKGDEAVGLPLLATILLFGAAFSLLAERRSL
jgi:hypothetical protein